MNKMQAFFSRLFGTAIITPLAAVMLVGLLAPAWSSPAFCGEIHDAAENGDLEKVKALLKDNPNLVFSKDDYGAMPLHYAAQGGRKDVVELLLANKADVNAKAKNDDTPLRATSYGGHKDVAELLRQQGGHE